MTIPSTNNRLRSKYPCTGSKHLTHLQSARLMILQLCTPGLKGWSFEHQLKGPVFRPSTPINGSSTYWIKTSKHFRYRREGQISRRLVERTDLRWPGALSTWQTRRISCIQLYSSTLNLHNASSKRKWQKHAPIQATKATSANLN